MRFVFVCFNATERSKCLPGMLVYLNLDSCASEMGAEVDLKPEHDLLYFGGGGIWVRYFNLWGSLWDGVWDLMHPTLL